MANVLVLLGSIDPRILILAIVLIFILQSPVLTFPGYLVMVYAGFQLGAFQGGLVNYFGLLLSAIIGYKIGSWTAIDTKSGNRHLIKFRNWVERRGINTVLLLRVFPFLPYNVVSVGSGFARLDFRRYLLSSALPLLVWSFFWSYIGSEYAIRIISEVNLDLNVYHAIGAALFVMLIVGLKFIQMHTRD